MSTCVLKGSNTESIDLDHYPSIKQCYQELIEALVEKGFLRETIKIRFDDEQRQIHFGYHPDEIDTLVAYVNFENKLQETYTRGPFSEGWAGDRYHLWHNKAIADYLVEIKELCELHTHLSKQRELPYAKWRFSQQSHPYLSVSERKTAVKKALFEIRKENAKHQGIFLNEIHHHQFPKKFLEANLDYFKELGVKTLFFEFLLYDRHQALLDTYFANESEELPPELAAYLSYKDRVSGCEFSGYTDIVKAAKRAGIRVVALDSYPSILSFDEGIKRKFFGNDPTVRLASFNGNAAEIIANESQDEPYLVFLGFDHGYTQRHSKYKGIKSVAELLPNTCSIFLSDSPINYGLNHPPFFSDVKPVVFEYSKNSEAGADIVESRWRNTSCRL